MNASPIAPLVRAWVDLYTRGLPDDTRAARLDEVEDDVWCQREEAFAVGRSARSLDTEMLLRLLFGMPADVSWRLSAGGGGPTLERTPSRGARVLGVLAILGAASWTFLIAGYVFVGESIWGGPAGWVVFGATVVGGLAFAGAATGLALRYQDRLGLMGSMGGVLGGIGALFGALGAYQADVLLPLGSGIMAWELGRAHILARRCAAVHALSGGLAAFLLLVVTASFPPTVWSLLLIAPYLVSWMAIGVWLLGGVPSPHERGPAPDRPF